VRSLLKHFVLFIVYGALCSSATLIIVYLYHLQSRPELSPWHTASLDTEFRPTDAPSVKAFHA